MSSMSSCSLLSLHHLFLGCFNTTPQKPKEEPAQLHYHTNHKNMPLKISEDRPYPALIFRAC